MAGEEGIEPPNAWTKTMCLTTWRLPNVWMRLTTAKSPGDKVLVMDYFICSQLRATAQPMCLTTWQNSVKSIDF